MLNEGKYIEPRQVKCELGRCFCCSMTCEILSIIDLEAVLFLHFRHFLHMDCMKYIYLCW
ncbi:hypothetical protein Sjap_002008 [Stephania japonica]|uniref:Uncharacterized protein n=1 Tax=Stephania japonica TaxID=461633 RepID=A0AAP0KL23_9MAGN